MRLFTLEVFDDVISGTGTNWYSTAMHNSILGSADVFAIQAVTTGVSGTTPTLTVRLQSAADAENWANAAGTAEINAQGIANETSLVGTNSADPGMIQANVRLQISLGGTSPKCRLRLYVTGHAYGTSAAGRQ
jgi:hypothetical protein